MNVGKLVKKTSKSKSLIGLYTSIHKNTKLLRCHTLTSVKSGYSKVLFKTQ